MTDTRKMPWKAAATNAEAFLQLFPPQTLLRWEIAGSVRRRAAAVGDIDHVIEPAFGTIVQGGGLFPEVRENVNLLWHHLDALVRGGAVDRAIYGDDGRLRWGEKSRGVIFRGVKHELWTASADNWGAILAIRTGPAEFAQRLVMRLRDNGWRNADGFVRPITSDQIIPMPDEETYFRYAGLKWRKPEERK